MLVNKLNVIIIKLYPSILYSYDRNIMTMLITLPDMNDYTIQPVKIRFTFFVIILT
jgi:hypothetical protein